MTIRKRFHQDWIFKCPDAVLTCSILKCKDESFIVFGGHDKKLYLMDKDRNIIDQVVFDGWCRCTYCKDITGDGCDEILVGSGDGSCLVLKFDQITKKLINLKHYKGEEKVNCCIAGDLYRKGVINLIYGGEDDTLKIFNTLASTKPDSIFYFDSWVMSVDFGFFKLPEFSEQILGLITGTKNGHVYFIAFNEDKPGILWQKNLYSQINDIKIGDVSNDGYNEIIACTNDSYVKIMNSVGKKLHFIYIEESRPVSLLIDDIDGNNANEIIVGCADGSLRVYENINLNSLDFQLKWKSKIRTSIKNICSYKIKGEEVKSVLFGGYDRTIRKINDFEWGQKQKINIPKRKVPDKIKIKVEKAENEELSEVPMNLREYIFKIIKYQKILGSLEILKEELLKIGYSKIEIEEELEYLKSSGLIVYEKYNNPVYFLNEKKLISQEYHTESNEEMEEYINERVSELETGEIPEKSTIIEKKNDKNDYAELNSILKNIIIEYLKEKKIINSKSDFIKDISKMGFSEEKIEQKINSMKENGIIKYSRSVPRGWSLVS
ncbi:MAG: hypothetical protein ACFFBP_09675 [Promethearchaeota archaeon]